MATPELRVINENGAQAKPQEGSRPKKPALGARVSPQRRSGGDDRLTPALRLLEADRSDEIAPILLEEIIALGYERAFVLNVDYETGRVEPTEWLNCSKGYLERFRGSLYSAGHPVIDVLHSLKPQIIEDSSLHHRSLYVHPMLFNRRTLCWEAGRDRRHDCLGVENHVGKRRLQLEQQTCTVCNMRGYAILVAVEIPSRRAPERKKLADLIELANSHLARLFKVEHYFNRMSDMEVNIHRLETVHENMTDPVVFTDSHNRVILQNKAAERFFKLPEVISNDSAVSEGLVRAVELNNLLFSAALSSMAVSGSDTSRDITLVDALEGEEMLFEAVSTPTYSREGKATGVVTVMRDVTDLRRADQELRANYDRLRSAEELLTQDRDRLNLVIENIGDAIVVCNGAAKPVILDPLAQKLLGTTTEASQPFQMQNQAKFDAFITTFTFGFEERQTSQLTFFDPQTGSEVEYEARSGKILDERGQAAFTVTVLRDLTPLRKLEELRVQRRMLEVEKFAATGRLAATIAHEVNNPMESIKNAIYMLDDMVTPDGRPMYDILKSETERVARIVRQMLGLYRNAEQVKPININGVIEDTLTLLNRQLQRNSIDVVTDLGNLPNATVAADQLRQVLSNLVINAKDAMPTGGKLRIRSRYLRRSGNKRIQISIADTGVGIPKNMLQTIFEPFVTTKGEKGTGLGLWIVKGIVSDHNGKLKVRSKEGKGSVFTLLLPAVQ